MPSQDLDMNTTFALQSSITATLTYIMGRASVAELYGIQAYLSNLASQMAPVHAARFDAPKMSEAEIARHNAIAQQQMAQLNAPPPRYRQEG